MHQRLVAWPEGLTDSESSRLPWLHAGLIDGDSTACIYFKQCGGLEAAAAAAAAAPGSPAATAAACTAAALQLLNTAACSSDRALQALPATGILPTCLDAVAPGAAASGASGESARAAAALLCTLTTAEGVRKQLSELLGRAPAQLQQLLERCRELDAAAQALLLAALCNCCVDRPAKQAFASIMQQGPGCVALQHLEGLLQQGQSPEVAARLASLLGNLCGEAACRQLLAGSAGLVGALCALLLGKQQAQGAAGSGAQLAAAEALCNICTEAAAQQQVLACCQLSSLLQLLPQPGVAPTLLAARVAGILARLAKQPLACRLLQAPASLEALLAALHASSAAGAAGGADEAAGAASADAADAAAAARLMADGLLRALAQLSAGAGQELLQRLAQAGAAQALVRLLRQLKEPGQGVAAPALLGNAALCVGNLAAWQGSWAQLRQLDAVEVLVRVAHDGRGDAASRNAAIALARLARDGAMMARLKELHGLEVIYQYVRP